MVGLSVVLEGYKDNSTKKSSSSSSSSSRSSSQVVNKSSMIKTSPTSPTPSTPNPFSRRSYSLPSSRSNGFLEHCFLCRQKLLPGKDIYMYKGDRAFCSEECRCRQIFMDEEETIKAKRDNCSLAAIKPQHAPSSSPSSTSSSSSSSRSNSSSRKGASKRANGFAY